MQPHPIMGRRKNADTIEVHEGIYLRRREDCQPWQCYFRMNHQQFRKSTGTRQLAKAKRFALRWHRETSARAVSFSELTHLYLDYIGSAGKRKSHQETIERHFLPFFKSHDDVSYLRMSDIQDYIAWRRARSQVKPQTINRENTVLRQIIKFGQRRGWLDRSLEVERLSERLTHRRRPHFTPDEYSRLVGVARERIEEFKGKALQTTTLWRRELLHDYIRVLANTGLRVDESKTVTWRNVDLEERLLLLEHAGKTKRTRKVWIRPEGVEALDAIHRRRLSHLKDHRLGPLDPNERVFSLQDGTPVRSFRKGFDALLGAAGFEYPSGSEKHVLTSFRHTYATERLTTTTGPRASIKALALQMGTSVQMIEKHYGHDLILDYENELAG